MAITGHTSNAMFERYNTVDDDDGRSAVDKLSGYLKNVDQTVDQVASEWQ
jgi:hypothetical protein